MKHFPRTPDPLSRAEGQDPRPHLRRTRQGRPRLRSAGPRRTPPAGALQDRERSRSSPHSNPQDLRPLPPSVHLLPLGWLAHCPLPKVTFQSGLLGRLLHSSQNRLMHPLLQEVSRDVQTRAGAGAPGARGAASDTCRLPDLPHGSLFLLPAPSMAPCRPEPLRGQCVSQSGACAHPLWPFWVTSKAGDWVREGLPGWTQLLPHTPPLWWAREVALPS